MNRLAEHIFTLLSSLKTPLALLPTYLGIKPFTVISRGFASDTTVLTLLYVLISRGFASDTTARLMWKRAQKQKQFHKNAARRKKLADPSARLAHFKKNLSNTVPDHTPQPGDSSGQRSSKLFSSPSLEELSQREHSRYKSVTTCTTTQGLVYMYIVQVELWSQVVLYGPYS